MSVPTEYAFSSDRATATAALEAIGAGRGWCNLSPNVEEEVADMKVNYFGLRLNRGVTVASFVTSPSRKGIAQSSTLGVLHSRSRLGRERILAMLAGAPYTIRQDHNTRGLLLTVPVDAPSSEVLRVMCTLTESLCDYEFLGSWTLSQFMT